MLRIAAIEFLNAAPLMAGLDCDPRFALRHTLPSACADALRDGSAELGVIPVIELARIPSLVPLGGIGVASGAGSGTAAEVRSILLVARCPLPQVQSLALDPASRTSAALAQILLRRRFGADFKLVPTASDWRQTMTTCDAALFIGDPALRLRISRAPEAAGLEAHDLARIWQEWMGVPFVFALWGIRKPAWEANQAWLPQRLRQALDEGLVSIGRLIEQWSQRLALPESDIRQYLERNVTYRLTAAHEEGMRRFFALAAAEGMVPADARTILEALPA
ncbi:MAG TPA: menaquinone biosynthesis protein [Terriglobales bacterium]|nr:menaquinone biosynthesis protein [Terriglobales bacterium]